MCLVHEIFIFFFFPLPFSGHKPDTVQPRADSLKRTHLVRPVAQEVAQADTYHLPGSSPVARLLPTSKAAPLSRVSSPPAGLPQTHPPCHTCPQTSSHLPPGLSPALLLHLPTRAQASTCPIPKPSFSLLLPTAPS